MFGVGLVWLSPLSGSERKSKRLQNAGEGFLVAVLFVKMNVRGTLFRFLA